MHTCIHSYIYTYIHAYIQTTVASLQSDIHSSISKLRSLANALVLDNSESNCASLLMASDEVEKACRNRMQSFHDEHMQVCVYVCMCMRMCMCIEKACRSVD